MHWNIFGAVPTLGSITVMPGPGGYTWEEVHAVTVRRLERDMLCYADQTARLQAVGFWRESGPHRLLVSTARTRWVPAYTFGVYAYPEDEEPPAALARVLHDDLPPTVVKSWGLPPDFPVRYSEAMRQESTVSTAVVDMRITELHNRVGVPRSAPSLETPQLLDRDPALDANFEALRHMADCPLLSEEDRREAAHLTYRLGLMRFDLYERARELGIKPESDPDLAG
ncbi:hypothetical protein [Streptomyces sp. MN6]